MKHKTILKQALLFKDGAEPIYSKIQKLYEAIIQYQELHTTSIISAKPKQRAKLLNQDLLRGFANSRGFRIVFVTPEPVYAKPDEIKYYKFMRRKDNRFEIIRLNV